MDEPDALCRCGHAAQFHEHYRDGSDCGKCGRTACAGFRPATQTAEPKANRSPRAVIRRMLGNS
jgi:bacterioferritin-associated ferredoxin